MKVTHRWLRELVDTDLDAEELAERLTAAGLEVDSVRPSGAAATGLLVARVTEVRRHPAADRLSVCTVDAGGGTLAVVCGAPNVRADTFVAFAPVGARLPDGTELRRAKLRGEVSEGMILSEAELGLVDRSEGILELDGAGLRAGAPLAPLVGFDDWIIDIDLTPNRPDCLSVLGIAREVAALTGARLVSPATEVVEEGDPIEASGVDVQVIAAERCARYAARLVRGVRVAPSPLDVRARLAAVGLRPISNVVDATNLVLMELGHPLHAFDLARVGGRRVVVRRASEGETLETLDGACRSLDADDLVIADAARPIALAGVMGGQESGVTEETVDLLLESAWFDPAGTRRTARRHGLHTEASHRFERGADPVGLAVALDRLARVTRQLAGGHVAPGVIDQQARPWRRPRVAFRPLRARRLLGFDVPDARVAALLERIGVAIEGRDPEQRDDPWIASIPSFRPDLTREVDLIEEVARLVGLDQVPTRLHAGTLPPATTSSAELDRGEEARDVLVGLGFHEAVTLAFTSETWRARFACQDDGAAVELVNPLSDEGAVLASSLLEGLVRVACANLSHRAPRVRLFEVARVFRRDDREQVREVPMVAAVLAGRAGLGGFPESQRDVDLFDLKGALETLLERLAVPGVELAPGGAVQCFEPGEGAALELDGRPVGHIGRIASEITAELGVETRLFGFQVELEALGLETTRKHRAFGRQPAATRDLALVVERSVPHAVVAAILTEGTWVESAELFDVYEGGSVRPGARSLAYRLTLRHPDRTLTETDVQETLDRLMARLAERVGATLRD